MPQRERLGELAQGRAVGRGGKTQQGRGPTADQADHGRIAGPPAHFVDEALTLSARRWAGHDAVRFVSDTTVVRRWSEAK